MTPAAPWYTCAYRVTVKWITLASTVKSVPASPIANRKVGKSLVSLGRKARLQRQRTALDFKRCCAIARRQTRALHTLLCAVDRFSRDTLDHHVVKRHLGSLGVLLRSATQPLGESPAEALMEGLLSQFAQFDNAIR